MAELYYKNSTGLWDTLGLGSEYGKAFASFSFFSDRYSDTSAQSHKISISDSMKSKDLQGMDVYYVTIQPEEKGLYLIHFDMKNLSSASGNDTIPSIVTYKGDPASTPFDNEYVLPVTVVNECWSYGILYWFDANEMLGIGMCSRSEWKQRGIVNVVKIAS